MKKTESTTTALTVGGNVKELTNLIPDTITPKELFNMISDTKPIADLTDEDSFKVQGMLIEIVEVPKDGNRDENGNINTDNPFIDEDAEMVERERLTLITDKGVYHSFSKTLNSSLIKAMNIFGADFPNENFKLTNKQKNKKSVYVMTVL